VDEGELAADLMRKGYVKKDDPDSAAIAMDMYRRQLKDEERARRTMVGQDEPILELPVPPLTMKRDEDKDLLRHMAEKDLKEYERSKGQRFDLDDEFMSSKPEVMPEFDLPHHHETHALTMAQHERQQHMLERELLSPTQLTPKDHQEAHFHPSFQHVLEPETFTPAKPVIKQAAKPAPAAPAVQPQTYIIPVYVPYYGQFG